MAELLWFAATPLSRAIVAGNHGAKAGTAGVSLAEIHGFELVQIMARRGAWQALAAAAKNHFGASPPDTPRAVQTGEAVLIWYGPDQFLALSPQREGRSGLDAARTAFAGIASLSDQSDGRALVAISGVKARNTLAKICSLDLYPAVFPPGLAAATSIDHNNDTLWRGADTGQGEAVYFLLVFSTFAESLLGTVLDSAAEYGVDVRPGMGYATSGL